MSKTLQNASRYFILLPSLNQRLTQYQQYKIIHKIRNNSKVTKEELIPALANIVPEGHTVSLGDPELVILVNVYKVRLDRAHFSTCPTIESDERIAIRSTRAPNIPGSRWPQRGSEIRNP